MTDKDLDALMATVVMGWTGREHELWTDKDGKITGWGTDNCVRLNNVTTYDYFEPSTDIASAWKVFMHLSRLHDISKLNHLGQIKFYKPVVRLEVFEHEGEYECRIGRCKGFDSELDVVGRAEERNGEARKSLDEEQTEAMCRAICYAALKAMGVEVKA